MGVEDDLWTQDILQDQMKKQGPDFIQGSSQSTFEPLTRQVSDPQTQSGNPMIKIEMGSVIDLPNRSVDVLSKDYEKCGEITKRELEDPKQVNAIQDRVEKLPAFQSQANSTGDWPKVKVEAEDDPGTKY